MVVGVDRPRDREIQIIVRSFECTGSTTYENLKCTERPKNTTAENFFERHGRKTTWAANGEFLLNSRENRASAPAFFRNENFFAQFSVFGLKCFGTFVPEF
jgi:hypothetical protein